MTLRSHYLEAWQSCTVLVVGDVMLDSYLQGTADRLCQEAPVPVVAITHQQDYPGGAANVAANIRGLGGNPLLLSVVGADAAGERLRSRLQHHQVSTDYLTASPARSTLAKQRIVANDHLLVRLDQGSTEKLSQDLESQFIQQLTELFLECDAVIISDYHYGILIPPVIRTLASLQQQHPRTFVLDAKNLSSYQSVRATVVKPNYVETLKLLNLPAVEGDRVQQILPHGDTLLQLTGADRVAVTLDRDGVLMLERDRPPHHFPTRPAPSHHASGAGDTFISAFTLALAVHAPTDIATELALAATAIAVSQPGTTVSTAAALQSVLATHTPSLLPL